MTSQWFMSLIDALSLCDLFCDVGRRLKSGWPKRSRISEAGCCVGLSKQSFQRLPGATVVVSGVTVWFWVALMALLILALPACSPKPIVQPAQNLATPYAQRMVLAVAPLRNESGNQYANGVKMADRLVQELERIDGVSTVPVNRVLAAMQQLGLNEVATVDQAMAIRAALDVDGLVAGTVTAYDPYEPQKLGMALDYFLDPRDPTVGMGFNPRQLTYAAVDEMSRPLSRSASWPKQPVVTVSGYYDASFARTDEQIKSYAIGQGLADEDRLAEQMIRIDMDRYARFVSYALCAKLMAAEHIRLTPPEPAQDERRNQPDSDQVSTTVEPAQTSPAKQEQPLSVSSHKSLTGMSLVSLDDIEAGAVKRQIKWIQTHEPAWLIKVRHSDWTL